MKPYDTQYNPKGLGAKADFDIHTADNRNFSFVEKGAYAPTQFLWTFENVDTEEILLNNDPSFTATMLPGNYLISLTVKNAFDILAESDGHTKSVELHVDGTEGTIFNQSGDFSLGGNFYVPVDEDADADADIDIT